MKNYGLNIELEKQQISEEDWIFGATSQDCIALIPENERDKYLPLGEVQRGRDDMMDCASRGPVNKLEAKLTYLYATGGMTPENADWLLKNGYFNTTTQRIELSDAFVAINSGTTRQGNSLKAPLDAIRKQGLIPKHLLPLDPKMTWEEYHNPQRITEDMRKLGRDFLERFVINYERVYENDFGLLLDKDILVVGGFAWPEPVSGEYKRSNNQPNHCFILYKKPKYYAFDNYIDSVDGDYTKKLSADYDFIDYGYRVYISREVTIAQRESYWKQFLEILAIYFGIKQQVEKKLEEKTNEKKEEKPKMENIIYKTAKETIGKDASPKDLAVDGLGCAESVSTLLRGIIKDFPIVTGTWSLFDVLRKRKDFVEVKDIQPGDIILCVTGMGNGKMPGHAGIYGENDVIMSNSSATGLWSENYTTATWKKRYVTAGGFKIFLYRYIPPKAE